ncbi:hypothetical protein [Cronobacter dublinensis]|uniref:hypothetical protein n=1 Tax=Cronobacter dublinensis TaxID=413497 RepID=UPI000CFBFF78|nr:hypothetical protein [Cronobacter dublinensis]
MEIESARHLTPGEISAAKLLYKNSLDYQKTYIHNAPWFPFGFQTAHTALSKCLNPFSFNDVAGLLSLYETVIDRFAE